MPTAKETLQKAANDFYFKAVEELTGAGGELAEEFACKVLDLLGDAGDDDFVLHQVEIQIPLIAQACGLALTDIGKTLLSHAAAAARTLLIAALAAA